MSGLDRLILERRMEWIKRGKNLKSPFFCSVNGCNKAGMYGLYIIGYPAGHYCPPHKKQMEEAWIEGLAKSPETSNELTENL